jgi:hypothetical protein
VDLIALLEEKLGEIGTVLTGDPGDQSSFHVVATSRAFARSRIGERALLI